MPSSYQPHISPPSRQGSRPAICTRDATKALATGSRPSTASAASRSLGSRTLVVVWVNTYGGLTLGSTDLRTVPGEVVGRRPLYGGGPSAAGGLGLRECSAAGGWGPSPRFPAPLKGAGSWCFREWGERPRAPFDLAGRTCPVRGAGNRATSSCCPRPRDAPGREVGRSPRDGGRQPATATEGSPEATPSASICSASFIASSMRVSTIFDSGTVLMTSPLTKI